MKKENKIILVTGGAGYIGSICVEQLLSKKYKVIVIDNLQEGNKKAVLSDAKFFKGNFGDVNLLKEIFKYQKIDVVMHFAAETTVKLSMTDPAVYFKNNVINSINLLEVMRKYKFNNIIFSSTAAIFGEPKYVPIDEKHPTRPINPYGESKLMFEKILDWYHKAYGLRFNCFRYFNAAGASKNLGEYHRHESHLIPLAIQVLLGKREKLEIFGNDYSTKDGTCVRDYIHVIDIALAHIKSIDNLEKNPSAKYNLGNGKGFSNLEVIKILETISGKKIPYEIAPRRPGDPDVLIASSELAAKHLGWEPTFRRLEDIIYSAWEWHSKHPDGY